MLRYYIRSNKWTHTYKSDRKSFIKLIVRDGINTISNSFMCSHYFKGNDSKCVHNFFFSLLFVKWEPNETEMFVYILLDMYWQGAYIYTAWRFFLYIKKTPKLAWEMNWGNENILHFIIRFVRQSLKKRYIYAFHWFVHTKIKLKAYADRIMNFPFQRKHPNQFEIFLQRAGWKGAKHLLTSSVHTL